MEKTTPAEKSTTRLLWLDLTRRCQLKCTHCYNSSGPHGTHGIMTREDWTGVLDQAASYGVRHIQFIGGEPTLHPDFADLVDHALTIGLEVEVYSNLVHISHECWEVFQRKGLTLATSYYSDEAAQHNAVTGRRTHTRTRTNIQRAVALGIPLRVGIIDGGQDQRVTEARRDLESLGVTRVGIDHVRPFGRGAQAQAPDVANLCGRCGTGMAAIGPTGEVSPCVFSGWMGVGNVKSAPLASILCGTAMNLATTSIRRVVGKGGDEEEGEGCDPVGDGECAPGFPSSSCSPRS
ncbi:radical SAM protein [Streptomyces nigrescens]|uniref:radical SAM/SPASM domain-containing protein n=1 Tax=Streptomyces nigrescens TaxID=1920 RepID=UPI00347E105F